MTHYRLLEFGCCIDGKSRLANRFLRLIACTGFSVNWLYLNLNKGGIAYTSIKLEGNNSLTLKTKVELAIDELITLKHFTKSTPLVLCFGACWFTKRKKVIIICNEAVCIALSGNSLHGCWLDDKILINKPTCLLRIIVCMICEGLIRRTSMKADLKVEATHLT